MILATMHRWTLLVLLTTYLSFLIGYCSNERVKTDNFLREGDLESALQVYDTIIRNDPNDYLTRFKRGALYISLARHTKALEDFDAVLAMHPDMKAAREQKTKLTMKLGRFTEALKDANTEESDQIKVAINARDDSRKALKQKNFSQCIQMASEALQVAPLSAELRILRADCRLQQGDYHQAVADYRSAEKSGTMAFSPEIYVKMATVYYYMLDDYDTAMDQLRRCLQYDGEEKSCKNIHKKIRTSNKKLKNVRKKAWKSILVEMVDEGLYDQSKNEVFDQLGQILKNQLNRETVIRDSKYIQRLAEMQCQAAYNSKEYNESLCADVCMAKEGENDSDSEGQYYKILIEIHSKMEKEDYEGALHVINDTDMKHKHRLKDLYHQIQVALKQQRTKDYYKVLQVPRGATEKEIKAAYRKLSKIYHPDKAKPGDAEAAQKKMSDINEAYEVLSDSELRSRYDQGEDVNGQPASSPPFNQHNPFGRQQHPFFRQNGFQANFKYSNFYY